VPCNIGFGSTAAVLYLCARPSASPQHALQALQLEQLKALNQFWERHFQVSAAPPATFKSADHSESG
jgi:hypothetical protein